MSSAYKICVIENLWISMCLLVRIVLEIKSQPPGKGKRRNQEG